MKILLTAVLVSLILTPRVAAFENAEETFEIYGGAGIFWGSSNDSDGIASTFGARYELTRSTKVDLSYLTSGSLNLLKINAVEDEISIEDHDALSLTVGYFHALNKRHEIFVAGGFLQADVDFIEGEGIFKKTSNKNEGSYHLKAGWNMTFNNNVTFGAQVGTYELLNKTLNNLYIAVGYKF